MSIASMLSHMPLPFARTQTGAPCVSMAQTPRECITATTDRFFRQFVDMWILFAVGLKIWQFAATPMAQRLGFILLAAGLAARVAIAFGSMRLARYLMVIIGSAGIVSIPFAVNGVGSPAIGLMPMMLILAGWMLGRRAMVGLAAIFTGTIFVIWLGEAQGWVTPVPVKEPDAWATIWVSALVMIGAIVWSLIANYEAVHDKEAKLGQQLDAANAALTVQLAERTALLAKVQSQRDALERLATHDALTGLPVVRLAADRLQMAISRAQRARNKVALMFVDLDGFKKVNDMLGHEAGDEVLKQVAKRLQDSVRAGDTVARIGGDEFLVILDNLPDAWAAAGVARKILAAVARPIAFGEASPTVGASIGIAVYPDDALDPQVLRRQADDAMYRIKKSGKNDYAFAGLVVEAVA